MFKKTVLLVCALFICLSFTGCRWSTEVSEMLSSPAPAGELGEIKALLDKKFGMSVALKYPRTGSVHSAIIIRDFDGDKKRDAVAFFKAEDKSRKNDTPAMHIVLLADSDGKWKIISDTEVAAAALDKVELCDFSGSGRTDIAVGWELAGNGGRKLEVYGISDGKLKSRIDRPYTVFAACDINNDSLPELVTAYINSAQHRATATLITVGEKGIKSASEVQLDPSATDYRAPVVAETAEGIPAVYLDAVTADSGSFTELLCVKDGAFCNLLPDACTARPSNIAVTDLNGDGVPEVPSAQPMPSNPTLKGSENVAVTVWKTYSLDGAITSAYTAVNYIDGYCIFLPEKWIGSVIVSADYGNSRRAFYRYDAETGAVGEEIIRFVTATSYTRSEYDDDKSYTVISSAGNKVYYAKSGVSSMTPDEKDIKNMFVLLADGKPAVSRTDR